MDSIYLAFDSGKAVKDNHLYDELGNIEASPSLEYGIYKFKDRLAGRNFHIEIAYKENSIASVFLFPKDQNAGGFDTPRATMEKGAQALIKWFIKEVNSEKYGHCKVVAEFDPRSWMVYLELNA